MWKSFLTHPACLLRVPSQSETCSSEELFILVAVLRSNSQRWCCFKIAKFMLGCWEGQSICKRTRFTYNVGPPNYKLVYKPINYRYIYNNPQLWKLQTNLANYGAPHCIFLVMALQPLFPAEMTICDCWKFDELSQTGYGCGFKTGPTMSYISWI